MIKDVVIALLTTTINRYSDIKVLPAEAVCRELTDILDYIVDITDDKRPVSVTSGSDEEVQALKKELNIQLKSKDIAVGNVIALEKRIRELEEICQDNNEVIENQFKKIQRLESENMEGK